MKSYLLSRLKASFIGKRFEAFAREHPYHWLLWEPGSWKPPGKQTHGVLPVVPAPESTPDAAMPGDALALALDSGPRLMVGRSPDCQIVINDGTLSSQHLILHQSSMGWQVEDAGSLNGTTLDGVKLQPGRPMSLKLGARIEAGQVVLSYQSSEGVWERLELR